jgi:hypothetical protein
MTLRRREDSYTSRKGFHGVEWTETSYFTLREVLIQHVMESFEEVYDQILDIPPADGFVVGVTLTPLDEVDIEDDDVDLV